MNWYLAIGGALTALLFNTEPGRRLIARRQSSLPIMVVMVTVFWLPLTLWALATPEDPEA